MPIEIPSIEAVAHHEAGHAVAAYRLHRRFRYVTIEPDGRDLGCCYRPYEPLESACRACLPDILTPSQRSALDREIMVEMAGFVAEFYYREGAEGYNTGDCKDYRTSRQVARSMICHEARRAGTLDELDIDEEVTWHVHVLAEKTIPLIVHESWPLVEALASALLEEKTIRYMRARAIMKAADR